MILHHHHPHDLTGHGERVLYIAVAANVILTLGQIAGGVISGSLALIADAVHNLSDAASLFIALVAIKIGRKPPDQLKTFGYKRAEIIAALINLTTLIVIGFYILYEALWRFIEPQPIAGDIVVIVAGLALVVDFLTALLTWRASRQSMNIRAVFLHNLMDGLTSLVVIIVGVIILYTGLLWVDALATLVIGGGVLFYGIREMPRVIHLLMEGTPQHLDLDEVIVAMEETEYVRNVHHVHVWQLDEHRNALEAHVVLEDTTRIADVKKNLKAMLQKRFHIAHSTLEFESLEEFKETCKDLEELPPA